MSRKETFWTSFGGGFLALWRRRTFQRMLLGVAGLSGVVIYGVIGFVILGWSLSDALYMVAISVSTVGYGEVQPLDSAAERVHTIILIALGTVAVAFTVGNLIAFITEGEIQRALGYHRVRRRIVELTDHIIVAGYGRMGSLICDDLEAAGEQVVLIERMPDRRGEIERHDLLFILGDATEEEVLEEAGIRRARALVIAIPGDADSVFITLTARQMAPRVEIIARAEQPSTQKKLRQAGANHVVVPASIGAHRIASLLTNPSALEFAELVTKRSSLAIQMEDVPLRSPSPLIGQTLRDADIGRRTGVIVVAIKRADGTLEFPPSGDIPFAEGDGLVLLGREENLSQFRATYR